MAKGLKDSVQITAYIDPALKERMDQFSKHSRRKSLSFQVEEGVRRYLDEAEKEHSFLRPTQRPRSRHKAV